MRYPKAQQPKTIVTAILLATICCGCSNDRQITAPPTVVPPVTLEQPKPNEIVGDACKFLLSKQSDDGSWKSEHYGLLKSGQALTPFVLYSLLQSGTEIPAENIAAALKFIRSKTKNGVIGMDDELVLEYPVYSTAYALMCLKQVGNDDDQDLIVAMQDYLVSQQFTEARGFEQNDPAYGGWGFGGEHGPGETGHMDLAHVRRVLEALSMSPCDKRMPEVADKAQHFLRMVQKHPDDTRPQSIPPELGNIAYAKAGYDGGFYFSPVVLRANKGRLNDSDPPFWNSYATATCEGLLSLLAAGITQEDERVSVAMDWLEDHNDMEYPQGIPAYYEGEKWRDAVHFYHVSVRGEVRRALGRSIEYRNEIIDAILAYRSNDGSFLNPESNLMKEDDPIMCTALVVLALAD